MNPMGGVLYVNPAFIAQVDFVQALQAGAVERVGRMDDFLGALGDEGVNTQELDVLYRRFQIVEQGKAGPTKQRMLEALASRFREIPAGKYERARARLKSAKMEDGATEVVPLRSRSKGLISQPTIIDILTTKLIKEAAIKEDAGERLRNLVIYHPELFNETHLLDMLIAARTGSYTAWALFELVEGAPQLFKELHLPLVIVAAQQNDGAAWALVRLATQREDLSSKAVLALVYVSRFNEYAARALEYLVSLAPWLFESSHIPGMVVAAKVYRRAGFALARLANARRDLRSLALAGLTEVAVATSDSELKEKVSRGLVTKI